MAEHDKTRAGYRVMMFAGLADIVTGVVVALLVLTGTVPTSNPTVMALVAGLFALIGVGLVIFARNKLSQADDRRGDLN